MSALETNLNPNDFNLIHRGGCLHGEDLCCLSVVFRDGVFSQVTGFEREADFSNPQTLKQASEKASSIFGAFFQGSNPQITVYSELNGRRLELYLHSKDKLNKVVPLLERKKISLVTKSLETAKQYAAPSTHDMLESRHRVSLDPSSEVMNTFSFLITGKKSSEEEKTP